jgi:F-type H+-transporting ATPase subunit gamma
MATLKDVQTKISGVKKTQQITRAMNMVATSRLRGAQRNTEAFRPYANKFAEVLGSLAEKAGDEASPLLIPREEVQKVHLLICTSDRGLCGGFNINLTNRAKAFLKEKEEAGLDVSFTCFGKKGRDWCRKNKLTMVDQHLGVIGGKIGFNVATIAGRKLVDAFLKGEYDEVYVLYSEYISVAKQTPVLRQVLPIPPIEREADVEAEAEEDEEYLAEHICEPSAEELLGDLLPRNVYVQLYSAMLETSTSEHAARMMAMDNATKACKDMIENLTLAYNKARQAAITADLMDIVGGAEALKG